MTIFAVLLPYPQPVIVKTIVDKFPTDHLAITETQFLISSSGTAIDISAKLGISDPNNPSAPPTGTAIIFATSTYYGRASTNIWDWIKAKLEAPPSG